MASAERLPLREPSPRAPSLGGLVLDGASFRYGGLPVLWQAELNVPAGGALIVTGENGVGKSTLLYLCAGLLQATSGTVLLGGQRPDVRHPSALFRAGVRRGFLFQNAALISNMSALANVTLALRYHADVLQLDEDGISQRARQALSDMRVAQTDVHALPAHLSMGVRKRVALARALALSPNFVFLDDPDTGLDSATVRHFHDVMERLRDDAGVTLVVATNNRALMARLGVTPVELHAGQLIQHRDSLA